MKSRIQTGLCRLSSDVPFHLDAILIGEVMESLRWDSRKTRKSDRLAWWFVVAFEGPC